MNPRHQQAWNRLIAAARRAPEGRDEAPPYGFAVRVAALAQSGERPRFTAFERISLRAMLVAGALAVTAAAANYSTLIRLFQDETPPSDDPVAELVDVAS
jgi:hypothetical protein